jgi:hypothetical protein
VKKNRPSKRDRKVGSMLYVRIGRCEIDSNDTYVCYACDGDATRWPWPGGPVPTGYGCTEVNNGKLLPLCRACFESENANGAVRKLWGAPNMKFVESGELPDDLRQVVDALDESARSTHQ